MNDLLDLSRVTKNIFRRPAYIYNQQDSYYKILDFKTITKF